MTQNALPDLKALQLFVAVCESGNMSVAAGRVGLTQSAISHAVKQLESQLGVPLFSREKRPMQLTAAGGVLRQRAQALLEEAQHLPQLIRHTAGAAVPEIRLGMVDSFAATIGPRLIKEFLDAAAHLSVWCGLSPAQGDALMSRRLDLIVSSDPMEETQGLERHSLLREPFLLVTPRDGMTAAMVENFERIGEALPMIRYSARSHLGMQIDTHLRRVGARVERRLEIDSSDTVVAMVASGVGWAISTPLCLLQGRAHLDRVRIFRIPGPGFKRQLVLLSRENELQDLPGRIAASTRAILRGEIARDLRRFNPLLVADLTIGDPVRSRSSS